MKEDIGKRRKRTGPSQGKAEKMLEDNSANGQPLSTKQRGFFGVIASGKEPARMTRSKKRRGK